jgi:hypothetical protein
MSDVLLHLGAAKACADPDTRGGGRPEPVTLTGVMEIKQLIELRSPLEERAFIHRSGLRSVSCWARACWIQQTTRLPEFLPALAVFLREERFRFHNVVRSNSEMDVLEHDHSWVNDLLMQVHPSLQFSFADGKDSADPTKEVIKFARCVANWQRRGTPRRDYLCVQKHTPLPEEQALPLNGKMVSQLQLLVTIADPQLGRDPLHPKEPWKHYAVLIYALRPVHDLVDPYDPIHGMLEVRRLPLRSGPRRPKLGPLRFHALRTVIRNVHAVPVGMGKVDHFYVNPYVDHGMYI